MIYDVVRLRLWRDFAGAFALGTLILGILPLWSARTTGDWRLSPHTLYSRDYIPYDKPGFGVDSTPPRRPLSPPNRTTYVGFFGEHVKHTPAALPRIAFDRLRVLARQEWSGPRMIFVPFVLIGLTAMTAEVAFALVCSVALFVGYLSYGHWVEWTLYYFEATPILSVLAALGIWRVMTAIRSLGSVAGNGSLPGAPPSARRRLLPIAAASTLFGAIALYQLREARAARIAGQAREVAFRDLLAKLPFRSAVVFVHYTPNLGRHVSVVANSPTLATDPIWIVNDLGPRNVELLQYSGDRVPLAFYEDDMRIEIDRSLLPPGR